MIVDLNTRRQERGAERRQGYAARYARVLAEAASVYALANDEQQGELALVIEEALGVLLALRARRDVA